MWNKPDVSGRRGSNPPRSPKNKSTMSNYTYNKTLVATFYARPDKLNELLDKGEFDYSFMIKVPGFCTPFPLWRIPQCWKIIAIPKDFTEDVRPQVADFKRRNDEVKRIFEKRLGVEYTPIDYQSYHNDFFCDFPDESPADQLMVDSIQELLDAGALQIDIELYCAAAKFHFDEAKDLLEKGGNPAAWLPDKDFSGFQLDDHVGTESSYLCSLLQDCIVTECKADKVYYQDVKDLLGWAAFETMYEWIEKYRKHPHYKYPEIEE